MPSFLLASLLASTVCLSVARAEDTPPSVSLNGDLKTFTLVSFPYDNAPLAGLGWPEDPYGQGIFDARIKLRADLTGGWRVDLHHAVSTVIGSATSLGGSGVATAAPELVDLTWTLPAEPSVLTTTILQGRTDRLVVQGELGPVTVALGRQPISFGSGLFFTPLDLVSPFFPGTIDTEYKPGVDAISVSGYAGYAFEQRVVAAWVGSCTPTLGGSGERGGCDVGLDDLTIASWSRLTVGVSDLGLFLGEVHDDEVVGLSVVTAVGAIGLHADAALTLPPGQLDGRTPTEDPFVRAVGGADWRPGAKTTLSGELYLQSNGATDPADYSLVYAGDRYVRGELWAAGRSYVGLNLMQEILPTLSGSLAVLGNLEDASAMLIPALSVSVANNATAVVGAYLGVGGRPDGLLLRSELGALPTTAYTQVAVYF